MTLRLGAIADDYTGASDLANTLTRNGLRTVQTIGVPADGLELPGVDAVVVALKSRSISAADAVEKSLAAYGWLEARGAGHILFKVCSTFDSTDAGNIGPVTDALRQATGESIVLVTPAFPETGRTVYQGNLFVAGVPLAESPMKDHPLNPMRDSDLRRVLSRQSAEPVGLIPLDAVAAGDGAVGERLAALAREGCGAAIADAVFDADLETLGRAALRQRLSVGASGLGLGLARALADGPPSSAAAPFPALGGPAACLAGSCSAATLRQIAAAEASMPVLRLDAEALVTGNGAVAEALAFARENLAHGPVLIASSAAPDVVAALQARHGGAGIGTAIEAAFAEIAAGLVALGVRRLVVAGGETSGAVVDRLGLAAFALGPEIAPGVPVLRSLGGTDMRLALKSGNFGGPDFFRDALNMMP
ncbi:HPr kinase [Aureimonas sp. SA4125]|uniref:3-oxo-tetronate kinase n=1 Tax=Aureimonas sp. SA4125 TaxID=2826993 RepID=UPI001CC7DFD0|nr:3-oxo-tetronate kinase [Aureimonas sp. SA4125]BDA86414.1 HPr kinase [Aureimonas sp. SA4125]